MNKRCLLFMASSLIFSLPACVSKPPATTVTSETPPEVKPMVKTVNIGDGATLELKEPKDILPEVKLVQELTMERQGNSRSSQVILLSKQNKLTMVALMPFGGEVFRIEYDGVDIKTKALPVFPKDFDLKYALADMIISLATKENLQSWLSAGVEVVDEPFSRKILYRSRPLITITYSDVDRLKSNINFEHVLRGYRIKIKPISQEKP